VWRGGSCLHGFQFSEKERIRYNHAGWRVLFEFLQMRRQRFAFATQCHLRRKDWSYMINGHMWPLPLAFSTQPIHAFLIIYLY